MTSPTYCKDCIYWDITHAGTTTKAREGRCRRHAPTPSADDVNADFGTVWPATLMMTVVRACPGEVSEGELIDTMILTPARAPECNHRAFMAGYSLC